MNSLHQSAHSNQEGVLLLANGNYTKAIEAFNNSLSIIEKLTAEKEVPRQYGQSHISKSHVTMLQYETANISRSLSSLSDRNTDSDFYICHNVLLFNPRETFTVSHTEAVLLGAVVLFNVAVAHHCHGNTMNKMDSIRKSIELYEMCFITVSEILSTQIMMNSWHGNEKQLFQQLISASLNNQSAIFYRMGAIDHAQTRLSFAVRLACCIFASNTYVDLVILDAIELMLNATVMARPAFAAPCA